MAWLMSSLTERLAVVAAPLGADEQRRAVEAALSHLERRRLHVYGTELRAEKRRGEQPKRLIVVLLAATGPYPAIRGRRRRGWRGGSGE